jgi:hypothetical protein
LIDRFYLERPIMKLKRYPQGSGLPETLNEWQKLTQLRHSCPCSTTPVASNFPTPQTRYVAYAQIPA